MNADKILKKDHYYTTDHEWIDFQGTIAYVGVCSFKLRGIKQIDQLTFKDTGAFKQQVELIATIRYDDYQININIPVSGKIIKINQELLQNKEGILLSHSECLAWIALIIPAQPYERTNLLLPHQYKMTAKDKYAK